MAKKKVVVPNPPKKKKVVVPPPRKVQRSHFFVHPKEQEFEVLEKVSDTGNQKQFNTFAPKEQRRHFLYHKDTGEAYAEWVGNVAVCLETGDELFTSRRGQAEDDCEEWVRFDYSVPVFRREDDPTIYTDDLLRNQILTVADFFENGAVLSKAKFEAWKHSKTAASLQSCDDA